MKKREIFKQKFTQLFLVHVLSFTSSMARTLHIQFILPSARTTHASNAMRNINTHTHTHDTRATHKTHIVVHAHTHACIHALTRLHTPSRACTHLHNTTPSPSLLPSCATFVLIHFSVIGSIIFEFLLFIFLHKIARGHLFIILIAHSAGITSFPLPLSFPCSSCILSTPEC